MSDGDRPIVGWRRWRLRWDTAGKPVLAPAGSGVDPWPKMRPAVARCGAPRLLTRGFRRHPAPEISCSCGIYVSRSPADGDRVTPAYPPPPVVGTASVWGRVIEHELGYRAERAYPARLRLACALCLDLEPGPGHPAVVHEFDGLLVPLCSLHKGGVRLYDGRVTEPIDVSAGELESDLLDAYAVEALPFEPVERICARPPAPPPPAYWPAITAL